MISALPLRQFLDGLGSDATRAAYESDLRQFLGRSPESATTAELAKIGAKQVIEYAKRMDSRFKKATVARKLAALRSAFGWLASQGVLAENPASIVTPPRVEPVTTTEGLTESEAARMLQTPSHETAIGRRDRAILLLLLHNGLRRSEIARLRSADIKGEVDGSTIALIRRGKRVRAVKLKPEVTESIRRYHEAAGAGEWVFRSHSHRPGGETGLTPKAVWLVVKSAASRAGIAKRISPNSLRLTHITMALARGCPLGRVQSAVGHARVESTMRYGRLLDGDGAHATDYVSFGAPRRPATVATPSRPTRVRRSSAPPNGGGRELTTKARATKKAQATRS